MILYIFTLPTILIVFFQTISYKNDISKLKGIWVEKTYNSILQSSLSPKKAIKSYGKTIPYLEIGEDGFQWLYNFHDGDGYGFEDISYSKPNIISFSGRKGISKFIVYDDSLIWDNSDLNEKLTFIRVDKSDIVHYVNMIVISGKYEDIKGRIYSFNDSGVCNWNKKKIKYQLVLDCGYCQLDWLVNYTEKDKMDENIVYGFKRYQNELLFFESLPTDSELRKFKKDPFLRLKKIN